MDIFEHLLKIWWHFWLLCFHQVFGEKLTILLGQISSGLFSVVSQISAGFTS